MKTPSFQVTPRGRTKKEKVNAKIVEKILDYEYEKMMKDPDRKTLYLQYISGIAIGIPHENLLHIWDKFFELHKKYLKGNQ